MLPESAPSSESHHARQAIFIDVACADLFPVLHARHCHADIILLNPASPVQHMAAWAMENSGYDAIHLFSHGDDGKLYLGNGILDRASAMRQAADLVAVGMALAERGSLMVYGCDAARRKGAGFLTLLSQLIGAPVVGSAMLGGVAEADRNWPAAGIIETLRLQVQTANVPRGMLAA